MSDISHECRTEVKFDAHATCAECGVFGAFDFGETKICASCHATKGACCAEAESDD